MADPAERSPGEGGILWPEDTVEYRIYIQASHRLEDQDDALSKLALECNHASRLLSSCHVWHFAPFALSPSKTGKETKFIGPLVQSKLRGEFFHLSLPCTWSEAKSHALYSCHSNLKNSCFATEKCNHTTAPWGDLQ